MSITKMMDAVAEALLKPVSEVVTSLIGVYTVIWGLWVLNPFWDTFPNTQLYSALLNLLPFEWVWGGIAVAVGVITLRGVVKKIPWCIITGSAAAGWHWFIIAIFYFLGDVTNTGGITALFLSILCAYIYLNSRMYNKDVHIWESVTLILHLKKK